jgi:hypothetical protein
MRILSEGDTGVALAPDHGRVPVVYRYQDYRLDSGVLVRDLLVGVHDETGEVLLIPAQSTARIKAARASKDHIVEVRMSPEYQDVIALVADRFGVSPARMGPVLVRYYLGRASQDARLRSRLMRLAATPLGRGPHRIAWKVRLRPELARWLAEATGVAEVPSKSALVRAAILAAKEDVLDANGGSQRIRELAAAAMAA